VNNLTLYQFHNTWRLKTVSLLLLTSSISFAQGSVISVNEPRPLAKAAELLERKYGVRIAYEDATYAYGGDLVDKTDQKYKQTHPSAKVLIPKTGALTIVLPVGLAASEGLGATANPAPTIQTAIETHMANGYPGEFKLISTVNGDAFDIVPTGVRSAAGVVVADRSPLETLISFPNIQRNAMDTLKLICNNVSIATGKTITLGMLPKDLSQQQIQMGTNAEPARDVLARLFDGRTWADSHNIAKIPKLSWALLYGPDLEIYGLNVRIVMADVASPNGLKKLRPVMQ